MLTTGFKFFFGLFAALAAAAVVYGYTSGGNHVGPISMGWKGGVGDHIGYGVLATLSAVSLFASLVLVAFRDADADAQADLLGVDEAPPLAPVKAGWWPTVGAFGVGAAVIGLVLHPAVFALGLAVVALAAVEWTIDAWADRATGDRAANRVLRARIMMPVEIPVAGALIIGVTVLASSRVLLTVSAKGAVVVTGVIATAILVAAAVYVARPGLGRRLVSAFAVIASLALLVGGVMAAIQGERDFEEHESGHSTASSAEAADESDSMPHGDDGAPAEPAGAPGGADHPDGAIDG